MAKRNVTVNGFDLQDANFITQNIQHEQGHARDINQVPLASEPGTVITDVEDREKLILINGHFVTSSQTALEEGLDTLKREITKIDEDEEVEIVVDHAGTTRVYRGIWQNPESLVVRENYNIKDIGYTLEFLVTSYGESPTNKSFSLITITASPSAITYDIDGTAPSPLNLDIAIPTALTMESITVTNSTTNQAITFTNPTGTFSDNDTLFIDGTNKQVLYNGTSSDFTGVFPDLDPRGDNQQNTLIYSFAGSTTLDQSQTDTSATALVAFSPIVTQHLASVGPCDRTFDTTNWNAQSFTFTEGAGKGVFIELDMTSSYESDIVIEIRDDSGGNPNNVIYTKTFTKTPSGWTVFDMSDVATVLSDSTTYWVVVYLDSAIGGLITMGHDTSYSAGNGKYSTNSGSTWNQLKDCNTGLSNSMFHIKVHTDFPSKAQKFQVSNNMSISQVNLYLKGNNYDSDKDITLEIWDNTGAGGDPGTLVANATSVITGTNISNSAYSWIPFIFSSYPVLTGTTDYYLVLRVESVYGEGKYINWDGANSNVYANGEAYEWTGGLSWYTTSGSGFYDFTFKVYQAFTGFEVGINPSYLPLWQ